MDDFGTCLWALEASLDWDSRKSCAEACTSWVYNGIYSDNCYHDVDAIIGW